MQTELKHIDTIKAGDTILHYGKIYTVCEKNIIKKGFIGTTIFGDSYKAGTKLVRLVTKLD